MTEQTTTPQKRERKDPVQKLTERIEFLAERIAKDTAELAEAKAQLQAIQALDQVEAGQTVEVKHKGTVIQGVVLGVSSDEKGKQVRVYYGTGFSANVITVPSTSIVKVWPNQAATAGS